MSTLDLVLADLQDESAALDARVADLGASDWRRDTPAPGWTVAHQIAHLAWTDEVEPTNRLRPIAWLAVRTRDFAFRLHDLPVPAEEFRIELTAPDGSSWSFGDSAGAQSVTGPALDFCLLAAQRRHRDELALVAAGAAAQQWLNIMQVFAGPPGRGREQQR